MLLGGQRAGGLEHLVGTSANAKVIGEIDPTDCSGGVDQELRGARYIVAFDAGSFVEQVVAADYFGIGIGEKRVGVTGVAAEILRLGGRIDADSYGLNA